jgi:dTDP-4-amino-4,6-dideoxygalactose transaminase
MDYDAIIPFIFPILVLNGKRDKLMALLKEKEIQFGIHYRPNHLLTYFATSYHLPVTEDVYEKVLTIPLHPEVTDADIDLICSIINNL